MTLLATLVLRTTQRRPVTRLELVHAGVHILHTTSRDLNSAQFRGRLAKRLRVSFVAVSASRLQGGNWLLRAWPAHADSHIVLAEFPPGCWHEWLKP